MNLDYNLQLAFDTKRIMHKGLYSLQVKVDVP